jgi:hypothetical protein
MTDPTGAKEYRIADHLGSVRAAVTGGSVQRLDYEPFGKVLTGVLSVRKSFLDREKDQEICQDVTITKGKSFHHGLLHLLYRDDESNNMFACTRGFSRFHDGFMPKV